MADLAPVLPAPSLATNATVLNPYAAVWSSYKDGCFERAAAQSGYQNQTLAQIQCFGKLLNVTDIPSIYSFQDYTGQYQGLGCVMANVTYSQRFRFPGVYHFCTVPEEGYDAFLFASLALLASCFLFGKLSTVWVLITGCLLATLNYFVNLLQIGNAIALWLNIQPPDLFLYAFLPPLIVEQAIRIDFYLFKKNFVPSLMLAVVMVILTTIILTPLILFVLGFDGGGWTWVFAGLFSAIIAPTDALAVASVLKKSNGPAVLTNLLESESLLNDATGITLFQIFLRIINNPNVSDSPSVWSVVPTIIKDIVVLSAIGLGLGLAFSMVAFYSLRWLRWRGAGNYIEATFVLAMSYLVYWVTEVSGGSGVIGVVTFGLFGNATMQWGMTGSAFKSGDYDAMWDMISFLANGLVFFWAGVASVSFLIPSISEVPKDPMVYASIIIIYLFMMIIRTGCVALFNPLFHLIKRPLTAAEILFVGWCGLRGAVSLILLATISTNSDFADLSDEGLGWFNPLVDNASGRVNVKSDIALWTTTFVILTLVVNGPLIAPLMKSFGLKKISRAASKVQARAKGKILEHTRTCISKYQDDESVAFLTGADWLIVSKYVDLEPALRKFGRVKARKRAGEGRVAGSVDPTSYLSVLKALCVTFWRWMKHLAHELGLLVRFRCGAQDNWADEESVYDSRSVYDEEDADAGGDGGGSGGKRTGQGVGGPGPDGSGDEDEDENDNGDYNDVAFENECHFQAIERTMTRQLSMATVDLEQGFGPASYLRSTEKDEARPSMDSRRSAHSNEDSHHSQQAKEAMEEMNQVCLGGIAGQMLLRELKASQTSHDVEAILEQKKDDFEEEDEERSDFDAETGTRRSQYYSSLPATAGAELREGLRQNLERTRSAMFSGSKSVWVEKSSTAVATARKADADADRPTIRDLSDIFSGVGESDPVSSVAPVSPRSSFSPMEARSSIASMPSMPSTASTARDASGHVEGPRAVDPVPPISPRSSSGPRSLQYSYTVSGASAKQLQVELQKAEEIRRIYRPSISGRDLLGNKQAFTPVETHFGRDFNTSKDGGDVSRHLARRSNLHQLKQETLAKSASGKLRSNVAAAGIAELAGGVGECVIPEEMPKRFLDMAGDGDGNSDWERAGESGKGGADGVDEPDEHEENLDEIRARVIAGLKQRFTKRRAEGKISLEAFGILDQTCQEQIEMRGPLHLWAALERKAHGGLLVQIGYKAAFKSGKWFKRQRSWVRKLLHYPWEVFAMLIRKNVGRTVLIGCEVAIEYTLALAVSQHVSWLKLHDEYFATLLEEVNEEAEKSHAFVIDREIEAPDTFRAIQSYRAAVIVLKDIQTYVETLLEVGILSSGESEEVNRHIEDKLRKLELTGPVWRPARFSDIMKSLRPFIGLDAKTLDWLWNAGLYQEYMPGQAFFQEDTLEAIGGSSDANTGIFHILSGVAKKLIYSRDDGTLIKEEYLGVGSCFGVRRALGLATGRQTTVVYSTGNALGRGTVVFRLMQSDVDKILALSKGGSPTMHEVVTRWTKVAALNILEASEATLASQLETVLSYNAMRAAGAVKLHQHASHTPGGPLHSRAVSLSDVLCSETFLDDLVDDTAHVDATAVPQKVVHARAVSMAKEITLRLRRGFLLSEVKHLLRGDTILQTTTIVLLKGAVEMARGGSPAEAPAILPQLTAEEEASLAMSFAEDPEASKRERMPADDRSESLWTVSSLTAYVLIFPE